MLYNAEVRSRNHNANSSDRTNNNGLNQHRLSNSGRHQHSQKIMMPIKKNRKGKNNYNNNHFLGKCICLCIIIPTIFCFLYIHIFISPIDKKSLSNIHKLSSDVAEHVQINLRQQSETKLHSTIKKLKKLTNNNNNMKKKPEGPLDPSSMVQHKAAPILHPSNAFQNPHPHVLTDEEIEEEAMKETIAEWKERDGVSDEGRFKTFKKYKGRNHRPEPVVVNGPKEASTSSKKKKTLVAMPPRTINLKLGANLRDQNTHKLFQRLERQSNIECKDFNGNGIVLKKYQFNDNYCDCSDGRDEPGTSACAGLSLKRNTKFYCSKTNSYIYSSRVNDGFCDCCDGEDEYNGIVKCKNKCF